MASKKYKHKRTGNEYELVDSNIIGAGDLLRGKKFVIYVRHKQIFIREEKSFFQSFEELKK